MTWVLPIIGIGFVIFVHELGHYLAARATGVRVEAFSIGFGPRLFGFKRGDTDWKICLIPLGGFVKMAGETPGSPRTGSRDEFASKSVSQRSLIISAGVIMNVVFALVALPIAFMVGVPFEAPVIGSVDQGSTAWRGGLRGGDRVLSVDGRRTLGYEDVVTAIAIGGDVITIEAERDGERFTVQVPTEIDARRGIPTIGIGPTRAPIKVRPEDVDPALAAEDEKAIAAHRRDAGLRPGDVIMSVDGAPVSDPGIIGDVTDPRPLTLEIRRDGSPMELVLPPYVGGDQSAAPELFGVGPAATTVAEVVPGSPAAAIGLREGDRLVAIGGRQVAGPRDLLDATAANGARTVTVERRGETLDLPADLSDPSVRSSLGADIRFKPSGRRVVPLPGSAAEAAGIRPGDEIVSVDGAPVETFADILEVSSDKNVTSVTLGVRRAGAETREETTVTVARAKVPINRAMMGLEEEFARETVRASFAESFAVGFDYTVMMTARVFMTIKSLFNRRVSAEHLGGIITIFRQTKESTEIAISRGLLFMAVISINLAVLNVLPIPVLDGGWLLLLLIEKLRGRPVSERVLGIVSWIGLGLILALMLFATWNDIKRL